MDKIQQYQKLCKVKPSYFTLYIPYDKPSIKKSKLNLKEMIFDDDQYISSNQGRQ